MKQKLIWPAFGVSVYLLFLIATAPMAKIMKLLPEYEHIDYLGVSGSFWQGKVESVAFPEGRLSNFRWDTQWSKLFTGQLVSNVRFGGKDELSGKGTLGSGLFGSFAENLQLSLPMSMVLEKVTLPLPLTGKGELDMNIKIASAGSPICGEFDAQLNWLDGQLVTQAGTLNFKQVKAVFSCVEGLPVAKITEKSEQLELELDLKLLGQKQFHLKGWIKPGAKMPKGMINTLNFIGERDGQGSYQINMKEKF